MYVIYIYYVYVPRYIPCPHVSTFQYLYPIRLQSHFAPAPREFPGSIVEATVLCVCKRLATRKSGQAKKGAPGAPELPGASEESFMDFNLKNC